MTIRYLAILTACIAVALMWNRPTGITAIVQSGRDLDIAIVGHGFFSVIDLDTSESRYTRCGGYQLDVNGQIATRIDGRTWTLAPPISVPSDWERIAIHPDGRVQVFQSAYWVDIGQVHLARFMTSTPFVNALDANVATDQTGPPRLGSPGDVGLGLLQQGWIEHRPSTSVQLTKHLLLGFLASIVINALLVHPGTVNHLSAMPAHETILYTRRGCHLCDDAREILIKHGLSPHSIDIDNDPELVSQFTDCVPVVFIDGHERFRGRVNEVLLRRLLNQR